MQQWTPRSRRRRNRRRLFWKLLLVVFASALTLFGLVRLTVYGLDWAASRKTARELRDIYHAETDFEPILPTETPFSAPTETPEPAASDAPSPTSAPVLPAMAYPNNPKLQITSRFKALQKESKYIIGWLTLDKLLDEPVVQKDNVYFLTRDARGKENVNGALFLDSMVSLKTRPYALIIYGHNMKTGAMFGCLRNYENISYYRGDPFITFDSLYENGRYVVFAVGSVSTEEKARNYVDFFAFNSRSIPERQKAIDALISASVHTCTVDVQADDQLLVLVTCVDSDEERRVVAARRLRDGEDETALKKLVHYSRKK